MFCPWVEVDINVSNYYYRKLYFSSALSMFLSHIMGLCCLVHIDLCLLYLLNLLFYQYIMKFLSFNNSFFLFFWERARRHKRAWDREREEELSRSRVQAHPKQGSCSPEAGLELTRSRAQAHPMWDLNSWAMRSWPEPKSDT